MEIDENDFKLTNSDNMANDENKDDSKILENEESLNNDDVTMIPCESNMELDSLESRSEEIIKIDKHKNVRCSGLDTLKHIEKKVITKDFINKRKLSHSFRIVNSNEMKLIIYKLLISTNANTIKLTNKAQNLLKTLITSKTYSIVQDLTNNNKIKQTNDNINKTDLVTESFKKILNKNKDRINNHKKEWLNNIKNIEYQQYENHRKNNEITDNYKANKVWKQAISLKKYWLKKWLNNIGQIIFNVNEPYLKCNHHVIDEMKGDDSKPKKHRPNFRKLTAEDAQRINMALKGLKHEKITSRFRLVITRSDFCTLWPLNWINDTIINFYINLIAEYNKEYHHLLNLPTVYAMNTFFLTRLMESGYDCVKRWTRRVDIFSYDIIIVPIYEKTRHWCLSIINLKERAIRYYNSLGEQNDAVFQVLQLYLQQESMDKHGKTFDVSNFNLETKITVACQKNSSDCGAFTCMFANYICRNKHITFKQKYINRFRQQMMFEILSGTIID